jgi:hypothetical protein
MSVGTIITSVGPRLLAEEGDAEEDDGELDGHVRDEDDERHDRRARAEGDDDRKH